MIGRPSKDNLFVILVTVAPVIFAISYFFFRDLLKGNNFIASILGVSVVVLIFVWYFFANVLKKKKN